VKKFSVLVATVVVSLSLGACQGFKALETLTQLGTASISNPVTPERLLTMERATTVVFKGLNAWRDSCEQGLINTGCKEQIRAVQVYTVQIPPYLTQLRKFVRSNDQVNAGVVWGQLSDLISIVKGKAAEGGVTIGGAS